MKKTIALFIGLIVKILEFSHAGLSKVFKALYPKNKDFDIKTATVREIQDYYGITQYAAHQRYKEQRQKDKKQSLIDVIEVITYNEVKRDTSPLPEGFVKTSLKRQTASNMA